MIGRPLAVALTLLAATAPGAATAPVVTLAAARATTVACTTPTGSVTTADWTIVRYGASVIVHANLADGGSPLTGEALTFAYREWNESSFKFVTVTTDAAGNASLTIAAPRGFTKVYAYSPERPSPAIGTCGAAPRTWDFYAADASQFDIHVAPRLTIRTQRRLSTANGTVIVRGRLDAYLPRYAGELQLWRRGGGSKWSRKGSSLAVDDAGNFNGEVRERKSGTYTYRVTFTPPNPPAASPYEVADNDVATTITFRVKVVIPKRRQKKPVTGSLISSGTPFTGGTGVSDPTKEPPPGRG